MPRYDLTLDVYELNRDGVLAHGAHGTFDGTHLHGAPIPIHTRALDGRLTLTYMVDYLDRRATFDITLRPRPALTCHQCHTPRLTLRLTNDGTFACPTCFPDGARRKKQTATETAPNDWEGLQADTLAIRKELKDYVNAPLEIPYPGEPMTKARWRKLMADLDELEPRMLDAYKRHVGAVVDMIDKSDHKSKKKKMPRIAKSDHAQKSPAKGA